MAISGDITELVDADNSERPRVGSDHPALSAPVACHVAWTENQFVSLRPGPVLGFSYGSPVMAAALQLGESVLDLGSRGGIDVFLAADQVGPLGQVIGLDGSKDMIDLARRNAKAKELQSPRVTFTQASLTGELPIETASVDCVLSGCILDLLPSDGKASIFNEAFRVLKPNGRISLTDVDILPSLPDKIKHDETLDAKWVPRTNTQRDYENLLKEAGFIAIEISLVNKGNDDVPTRCTLAQQRMNSCCEVKSCASSCQTQTEVFCQRNLSVNSGNFATPYVILARKPQDPKCPVSPIVLNNWSHWADAYPAVQSTPDTLVVDEVAALIRDPTKSDVDFTIIDVRRDDHAGGHVRGSHRCPAQTFYDHAPEYFNKFRGSKKVIFYCQRSNSRGPRCAGWYQDYLNSLGYTESKAYVMIGGVKGWMAKYKGEDDLVDYD